jgi:uroporphyrinogen decarboxylase
MTPLTSHERIRRMFDHQEADRVPVTDQPWKATIERWHSEGLPKDIPWEQYFELDRVRMLWIDNSPRFEQKVLEENEEWKIVTTKWGATIRQFKHRGGVPEYLDFTVKDRESWEKAKECMQPDSNRIDWASFAQNYPKWRADGAWIEAGFWFGFDVTHSHFIGTENALMAMYDDPEWLVEIYNRMLDLNITLYEQAWQAGYTFDAIRWPDDMGYKGTQFFSLDMYRKWLKPVHARAAAWAKAKGCKVCLHSCGDVNPFVQDLIDIGFDLLNPLEVKAGMNPRHLKETFGEKLVFHGGLNAVLYDDMDKMEAEMRRVVPVMKKNGGYWLSTDHSVPDSVSLTQFKRFVEIAKDVGRYS